MHLRRLGLNCQVPESLKYQRVMYTSLGIERTRHLGYREHRLYIHESYTIALQVGLPLNRLNPLALARPNAQALNRLNLQALNCPNPHPNSAKLGPDRK